MITAWFDEREGIVGEVEGDEVMGMLVGVGVINRLVDAIVAECGGMNDDEEEVMADKEGEK